MFAAAQPGFRTCSLGPEFAPPLVKMLNDHALAERGIILIRRSQDSAVHPGPSDGPSTCRKKLLLGVI